MEPSKYQGKHLSTWQVIRLYQAGERNFRGAVLRGCNFREQKLAGADFSGADIRSTQFVDADLQGVNFSHAKAGLQWRWVVVQFIFVLLLAAFVGYVQAFSGFATMSTVRAGLLVTEGEPNILNAPSSGIAAGITVIAAIGSFGWAIARQGFRLKAFRSIAVVGCIIIGFAIAIFAVMFLSAAMGITGIGAILYVLAGPVAVNAVIAAVMAGALCASTATGFAIIFAARSTATGAIAVTAAILATFVGAIMCGSALAPSLSAVIAVSNTPIQSNSIFVVGAIVSMGLNLMFLIYVEPHVRERQAKLEPLRNLGLTFATFGGTRFSGANLSGATFSHACLNYSNYSNSLHQFTQLTNVRWHRAQGLNHAYLHTSILQDPRVCKLLTTLNGIDHDLSNANLSGANLAGAQLHRTLLRHTNLSGANLQSAELQNAVLTEANCAAANFTNAHLTGACIEAWKIDSTTVLNRHSAGCSGN
ncbi:pentapeptide repeat-containing protein [Leptolyngbya sp. AN02str]|uniref:pentapeptide repeat-containing protein n=1 Tax=Leptolyngbya sp. AN02str TaxID=3423363 RepID=UPI003D31A3A2